MAEGIHPVPSRTRKLSPPAPMVLPGQPGGRVGRRRTLRRRAAPVRARPFAFPRVPCGHAEVAPSPPRPERRPQARRVDAPQGRARRTSIHREDRQGRPRDRPPGSGRRAAGTRRLGRRRIGGAQGQGSRASVGSGPRDRRARALPAGQVPGGVGRGAIVSASHWPRGSEPHHRGLLPGDRSARTGRPARRGGTTVAARSAGCPCRIRHRRGVGAGGSGAIRPGARPAAQGEDPRGCRGSRGAARLVRHRRHPGAFGSARRCRTRVPQDPPSRRAGLRCRGAHRRPRLRRVGSIRGSGPATSIPGSGALRFAVATRPRVRGGRACRGGSVRGTRWRRPQRRRSRSLAHRGARRREADGDGLAYRTPRTERRRFRRPPRVVLHRRCVEGSSRRKVVPKRRPRRTRVGRR